jgi:hypothetical protein
MPHLCYKEMVWQSLPVLNEALRRSNKKNQKAASWRGREDLFYRDAKHLAPGLVNFSPAWFQMGHEVSIV